MSRLRRLASVVLVLSFLGAATQTLCASLQASETRAMACADRSQTSLVCCCDITPAAPVPAPRITATFIADQAYGNMTLISAVDAQGRRMIGDWFDTHRAGVPIRLTILHSALLL